MYYKKTPAARVGLLVSGLLLFLLMLPSENGQGAAVDGLWGGSA